MNKSKTSIYIVGAGMSGLTAALYLEKMGYSPTIVEQSSEIGGRVNSDLIDGRILDRGFQVLLTAYPMVRKYLQLNNLRPAYFNSGAVVFIEGKQRVIAHPILSPRFFVSTLLAPVGSVKDKFLILKLYVKLVFKSVDTIFLTDEMTTIQYLKKFGFSDKIIHNFFVPFFGGIFLENELSTSSRMFEFIFKMFASGRALLPTDGIKAVPLQLKDQLQQTTFHFNTPVTQVESGCLTFENGEKVHADVIIISAPIQNITSRHIKSLPNWKPCKVLYFLTEERYLPENFIALIPGGDSLINNLTYLPNSRQENLLSVTVLNNNEMSDDYLIDHVVKELCSRCQIHIASFLKMYTIPNALPDNATANGTASKEDMTVKKGVYFAGDYVLNGSLNAAMQSGEDAAKLAVNYLNG